MILMLGNSEDVPKNATASYRPRGIGGECASIGFDQCRGVGGHGKAVRVRSVISIGKEVAFILHKMRSNRVVEAKP